MMMGPMQHSMQAGQGYMPGMQPQPGMPMGMYGYPSMGMDPKSMGMVRDPNVNPAESKEEKRRRQLAQAAQRYRCVCHTSRAHACTCSAELPPSLPHLELAAHTCTCLQRYKLTGCEYSHSCTVRVLAGTRRSKSSARLPSKVCTSIHLCHQCIYRVSPVYPPPYHKTHSKCTWSRFPPQPIAHLLQA